VRDHCVVRVAGLPPQVTTFDFFRAIAEVSPVGRIIDCRLMAPSQVSVDRAAMVEFANDVCAQDFGLLAFNSRLHSRPPPPDATRVLSIHGPRDHELMTVSALGEFLDARPAVLSISQDHARGGHSR
jgi:hypothetical protein